MLTPERLREIRERCERATKGPWWTADGYIYDSETAIGSMYAEADNDFVVHAREDVPTLVDEVERLRGVLESVAGLISKWRAEAERFRHKIEQPIGVSEVMEQCRWDGRAFGLLDAASDLEDLLGGEGARAQ